jgi:solute carrier family 35 protein E3
MAFNFFSSIGIIFVNKIIFKTYHFHYATFVTTLHFFATICGLALSRACGLYKPKKLNHAEVLPISLAFCIHVIFNNLSLQYNSVGFYQVMKTLTTPGIAFIQETYFGVRLHDKLKLTVLVECVGVALATVSDVSVNFIGTIFAVLGLMGAIYYQLFVKTKQKALEASSFQVLHYQAPQSMFLTMLMIPLFDKIHGDDGLLVALHSMRAELIVTIILGASLAFCVNLSVFLVIGRTSPITYNVLGHFKLSFILAGGIMFFGGDTNFKRLLGMAITVCAVIVYTVLKTRLSAKEAENWDKEPAKNEADEEAGVQLVDQEGEATNIDDDRK